MTGVRFRDRYLAEQGGQRLFLFVAGSLQQGHNWASEVLGQELDKKYVPLFVHPQQRRLGGYSGIEEVFFVGKWGLLPAIEIAATTMSLSMDLPGDPAPQITYICDAYGEVIEKRGWWSRWSAESSGRTTVWHLLDALDHDVVTDNRWWSTMCGIPARATAKSRREASGTQEHIQRWGPPPGACRACVRLLRKAPREAGREAGAAIAMQALEALRPHEERDRRSLAESGYSAASRATLKMARTPIRGTDGFVAWAPWTRSL